MKNILIFTFSLLSFTLFGQVNCYENAISKYRKIEDSIYSFNPDSIAAKITRETVTERMNNTSDELTGCKMPDFTAKSIDGKLFNSNNLSGKVIVLNFWFTTCPPCFAEIPSLNKLVSNYKDSSVVFIAFSLDDTLTIKKFIQNIKFDYNIVSSEFNMRKKFFIFSYPTSMVIDKNGIVKQIIRGRSFQIYDLLKQSIDKCLIEK